MNETAAGPGTGPHESPGLRAGGTAVSETAGGAGSVALQVPSQLAGMSSGTPAALPGQAVVSAVATVHVPQLPFETPHWHAGEHVTVLGGASRYPVPPKTFIPAVAGHGGGVAPSGPVHNSASSSMADMHWPVHGHVRGSVGHGFGGDEDEDEDEDGVPCEPQPTEARTRSKGIERIGGAYSMQQ
jgi:hypothetical protein